MLLKKIIILQKKIIYLDILHAPQKVTKKLKIRILKMFELNLEQYVLLKNLQHKD